MRRRSLAAPILLIAIGGLFLFRNLIPQFSVWSVFSRWWPFLLIGFGLIQLFEVLLTVRDAPSASSRRGTSFGQVALILLICFALYSATHRDRVLHIENVMGSNIELFGEQYDYPVNIRGDAQGVTMLVLDNLRGSVTVTGVSTGSYSAEGHKSIRANSRSAADRLNDASGIRIVRDGNQLLVKTSESGVVIARELTADLDIHVPRGVSVEARGRSGDLTLNSLDGMLDIGSERGDIRLSEIGGNARLSVTHGGLVRVVGLKGNLDLNGRCSDVQLENVQGQVSINGSYSGNLEFKNLAQPLHFESDRTSLRIGQVSGTFNMDLGEIRAAHLMGPVKLKTRSRDIHIEDFADTMEIELERGDIDLTPGKMPLARIDVKVHNGDVDLSLPERAEFDLEATTRQGEVTNEYGAAIRTEVDGRAASLRSVSHRGQAIRVMTDRGAVSVKTAP